VGLLVLIDDHSLGQTLFQFDNVLLPLPRLLAEFVETLLRGSALDTVQSGVRFTVQRLPGNLTLPRQLADSALAAKENGGGSAKTTTSGYDTHGSEPLWMTGC